MFSELVQQNDGTTYVPFSDGIILRSQGYEVISQNETYSGETYTDYYESFFNGDTQKRHKCQYCGKPDYHANCHGHKNGVHYIAEMKIHYLLEMIFLS